MTITDFLLARIAEDEVAARAASPGGWIYGTVDSVAGGTLYDKDRRIADLVYEQPGGRGGDVVRYLPADEADANGRHIVRHNPARVLVECEAKRRIVDLHQQWPVQVSEPPELQMNRDELDGMTMRMSQQIQWYTEQEYRSRFGSEPPTAPMLRTLAQVYADHPDYREEWGVTA